MVSQPWVQENKLKNRSEIRQNDGKFVKTCSIHQFVLLYYSTKDQPLLIIEAHSSGETSISVYVLAK